MYLQHDISIPLIIRTITIFQNNYWWNISSHMLVTIRCENSSLMRMNEDMIGSFASCSQHDRMPTDEFHPLASTMIVYNYYLTRDSVQNFYHPLTERKRRVVEQYVAFLYFVQLVTLYPQRQLP